MANGKHFATVVKKMNYFARFSMKRIFVSICSIFIALSAFTQHTPNYYTPWVKQQLQRMSLREQIGQMLILGAWVNKDKDHIENLERNIALYKPGGLIFFQGHPLKQAYLINYYQQFSSIPLLISLDAEWGTAMRLKEIEKMCFALTIGAANSDSLAFEAGYRLGLECKRMGILLNYAPDADVNANSVNPIIGFRSFGQDPKRVAALSTQMMLGMQKAGIMACAKHFPGHGDAITDSHLGLPIIDHNQQQFDSVDLLPFKEMIKAGVASVMTAHLAVPAFEKKNNWPSSLSYDIVTELLRKKLNFSGLIITDGLNMKGARMGNSESWTAAKAVLAGNDMLCLIDDPKSSLLAIENLIKENKIDSNEINLRCARILYYKELYGLTSFSPINTENLMQDLNEGIVAEKNRNVKREIAKRSIVLVKDSLNYLPLKTGANQSKSIVWVHYGSYLPQAWSGELKKYQDIVTYYIPLQIHQQKLAEIQNEIEYKYKNQIVVFTASNPKIWGADAKRLPGDIAQFILKLNTISQLHFILFGNVYGLDQFVKLPCILAAHEDENEFYEAAAKALLGQSEISGILPVQVNSNFYLGQGIVKKATFSSEIFSASEIKKTEFQYDFSLQLDTLVKKSIDKKIFPGAQIVVLKNGRKVFHKSYGSFYYDSARPVLNTDMYDLASVSKIAATTLASMKLYETGQLDLDKKLVDYLPELEHTNKENIKISELLLHEAGLVSWIPFYKTALNQNAFSQKKDSIHTVQISNNCFMDSSFKDSIWKQIVNSELVNKGKFVYSDLSMILMQKVIERITSSTLESYVRKTYWDSMNLRSICFSPAKKRMATISAPGTRDCVFRNGDVQGFVHDPAAAMLGGMCGHAGVFATAEEVAALMQMLLNKGELNGKRYLKPTTVEKFTIKQGKWSNRGFGFDKPNGNLQVPNISNLVPMKTFGHSGFTGIWAWADPVNQIVVVICSNRTYPNEENKQIISQGIRGKIIDVVYKAL